MFYKRIAMFMLALLLLVTIAGCNQSAPQTGAVAVVNGDEIAREDFNRYLDQVKQMYAQQGVNLDDAELTEMYAIVQEQVLDEMINETLMLQAANQAGLVPSEEEIQNNINNTREAFESDEAFEQALTEIGMTLEEYTNDVREQLTIQAYINKQKEDIDEADPTPTDEEIQALYDEYKEQYTDMPDLEEVREFLEQELYDEKEARIIQDIIEELRNSASIQINL